MLRRVNQRRSRVRKTRLSEIASEIWTVQRVLAWTVGRFQERKLGSPRLDAELLLCEVLKWQRMQLYTQFDRPLSAEELTAYRTFIKRRLAGEPVAYLLGRRDFHQLTLKVDARALIPRPETEHLVDAILERAPQGGTVLDVCTGTGAIALAIKHARPDLTVSAIDVSQNALELAEENRAALGLDVRLLHGDLYAPTAGERFSVIVTNPPYVPSGEIPGLQPEVQREPKLALDGGKDGLAILTRLIADASRHLTDDGWFACELGEGQAGAVATQLAQAGFGAIEKIRDFAGIERVVLGQRNAIAAIKGELTIEPIVEPDPDSRE